ncbi:uncharacterized protein J7T54_001864 [Emericellopsis cladophorae]|uniref:PAS domain-containing protein n=1 Tax=Emericellopsis cladophorae TaxID=2686198 RepID=A0A9P9XXN1_9HYPO|nr:uncharacterized protein J7T54_001864 [Emericellopsis cladophorae]KAI6779448.1 hypothetical protein J7T54_001864 [Emericellopsis cladophorae]
MDNYYPTDQLQRRLSHQQVQQAQQQQHQTMQPPVGPMNMGPQGSAISAGPMAQNMVNNQPAQARDTLDEIIDDNHSALHRKRSLPQSYANDMSNPSGPRRMSLTGPGEVMNFADGNGDMRGYQFNQSVPGGYPHVNSNNMSMAGQMGNYMNPADYTAMSPDLMSNMIPSTFSNMNMNHLTGDAQAMGMFSANGNTNMGNQYAPNQLVDMGNDYSMAMSDNGPLSATPTNGPQGTGPLDDREDEVMHSHPPYTPIDSNRSQSAGNTTLDSKQRGDSQGDQQASQQPSSVASAFSPQKLPSSASMTHPSASSDPTTPANGPAPPPQDPKDKKTIYSKSGFDMLKALWLVATRKSPKIHLGAVDMSCAFVVCDVTMNDCPIIYVSDNFQNLTGYSRHDIVGQNCRFLQAPDGQVEAGTKREFVDEGAVYNLKKMIHEGREVQQSLINYRKGGKPFLNLLTMIPIPWDTDEIRYFIGFQIDLVECPDAIASGQELGNVQVNYKHSDIGQYIWTPPHSGQLEPDNGQTLGVDDVSTLLQQFSPKGVVSDWHKQSWDKMLLENTDDVVHVLSLKGLFLYLSPSCKRILEYDTTDLVGNSLSTVCHPSDIVPVTRELKDTSVGNPVNIVFRIRRKNSGYTWFESHGSLFVEQGKGRKCIILVGRKRPVIALSKQSIGSSGGIGDSELWTKLSTSGMFLFVSSNIRSLLDLQPEALIGTSIQDLMRKESRPDFGRAIEKARRGRIVTCKHEVQNRRGQVLQAQTTLYPGDASEGQKPSFMLAQTKLLKASSRSLAPAGSTKSGSVTGKSDSHHAQNGYVSQPAGGGLLPGSQDAALASEDNMFDELRTTKCSSWQFELRQMEKINRILAEELGGLLSNKKKLADFAGQNRPDVFLRGIPLGEELSSGTPIRPTANGEGGVNLSQLSSSSMTPKAASGAPSAHGATTMPPPSHSSMAGVNAASSMTSIKEERESSQTRA